MQIHKKNAVFDAFGLQVGKIDDLLFFSQSLDYNYHYNVGFVIGSATTFLSDAVGDSLTIDTTDPSSGGKEKKAYF